MTKYDTPPPGRMKTITDMALEVFDIATDSRGRETFSADSYGLKHFAALVRADEREACANVCDAYGQMGLGANSAANAIRARGNT